MLFDIFDTRYYADMARYNIFAFAARHADAAITLLHTLLRYMPL